MFFISLKTRIVSTPNTIDNENGWVNNFSKTSNMEQKAIAESLEWQNKHPFIREMTINDIEQIEDLERKVYQGIWGINIWFIWNEIRDMFNKLGWESNVSFVWQNEEWKILWYILAYKKKMENGVTWIHIWDFLMDEKYRWKLWLLMIRHWMDEVKRNYPYMAVFARAREKTSYSMIKFFAERNWYEITKDVVSETWWEIFHNVVLSPKVLVYFPRN